jgi:hypothetical protein
MLEHIGTIEALEKEAIEIDNFLSITCSEDINEVVQRGNDLAVYISRTGKMLADAKFHKDQKLKTSIIKTLQETAKMASLSVTTINKLIDANCEVENYMVNWTDRLNRTATHQLDWCRTLVSRAKEEMRTSSGVSTQQHNKHFHQTPF